MLRPLITEPDWRRLQNLADSVARSDPSAASQLRWKLDRARVVPQAGIPPTIVTMRSRISCWVMETGEGRELTLVYPWEASLEDGKVSVVSDVGVQLLGAIPGSALFEEDAVWRVISIDFQPEQAGRYEL